MSSDFNFSGKTILVTGASGGLGRDIALAYARHGGNVVVHYHSNGNRAEELAAELKVMNTRSLSIQADLTNRNDVDKLFQTVISDYGTLDVLINNAGLYLSSFLINDMPFSEWQKLLNANLDSVFLCTQAAGRLMANNPDGGSIINISSVEGIFPVKGHSHYNASKAGLLMFTRSSAQELGPKKVRVNSISPGLIWKDGLDKDWPDGVDYWLKNTPLAALGQAEDIANACLFLTSPLAKWITGENLVVDGGFSARDTF